MAFDGQDEQDETAPGGQRPRGLWHYVISLILLVVGLHALGASLCGGFFIVGTVVDGSDSDGWMPVILAFAAPCLIIGGAIAFFCFRALKRRWSSPAAGRDASP